MPATQRTPLSDEALYWLGRHPTLARLELEDTEITDAGLLHLRGLGNLGTLQVRSPQITDAGHELELREGRWERFPSKAK